ncbi:MAG: DUF393 domain-containing protein [Candidatus Omnitrophica bacterium]|nr:DUF393 domain-containing protein [Candidatus Omnitrophota bacterium]
MTNGVILIYDGECPLCRAARDWIEKNAIPGRIEFLPCQSEERKLRFPGINEEACLKAMQVILPDGRVFSGDKAFINVFPCLKRWRWIAFLFRLPAVSFLSPSVYAWVSRNRHRLPPGNKK